MEFMAFFLVAKAGEGTHSNVATTITSTDNSCARPDGPTCPLPSHEAVESIAAFAVRVNNEYEELSGDGASPVESEMSRQNPAEPAERTYKRALDIAKRAENGMDRRDEARNVTKGRMTLREFSERLISSRSKRDA